MNGGDCFIDVDLDWRKTLRRIIKKSCMHVASVGFLVIFSVSSFILTYPKIVFRY